MSDLNIAGNQTIVDEALGELTAKQIVNRIWSHDHTVWFPEPAEITNRLGWLQSPGQMLEKVDDITTFVDEVRASGFTHVLLLGMGGSSLAPEVFRFTFGVKADYLDLAVLDSTDPATVLACTKFLNPAKTLFIVSTKSGGTIETLSFFKYFYNSTLGQVGKEQAGAHFIAITDPGSFLEKTATELNFRKIFLNDPNIGGRYSVLSYFGLVPAALIGVDIRKLLQRSQAMAIKCQNPEARMNPGALLGAIIGPHAIAGRDKLTLLMSPSIASFGAWIEQLVAESSGKNRKGILPVDLETPGKTEVYGNDRLFIYSKLDYEPIFDNKLSELAAAGHPIFQLDLADNYDLGAEFFRWEFATAIACERLQVNPFDQPNVESAKIVARKIVDEFQDNGALPSEQATIISAEIDVYGDFDSQTLDQALKAFFAKRKTGASADVTGSYVAIQAYLPSTRAITSALKILRHKIRDRFRLATTVGYGPRFLHSTGQLHKGDAGNGLFMQISADIQTDVAIPSALGAEGSSISFGILKNAQAMGDRQALLNAGRQVIRFHIKCDVVAGINRLLGCF